MFGDFTFLVPVDCIILMSSKQKKLGKIVHRDIFMILIVVTTSRV